MPERKYCGLTHHEMDDVLEKICDIEGRIELTDEEQDAFDIAIQCITTIMNRMVDDEKIEWDD